jgi:mRNA interferase MazF
MRRGEIWWANFGEPSGSAPAFERPCVIISANEYNDSRIATVIVAAMTSNLIRERAPGNFRVSARRSGLRKPSVVLITQLATMDKRRMLRRVGRLADEYLPRLEQGLRLVLALP